MKPFDLWPEWAANKAIEEGWILTNDSSEIVTISRLDAPGDVEGLGFTEPKFPDDQRANAHVARRAASGSSLHLLAVWLQGYEVAGEIEVLPPNAWRTQSVG